MTIFSIVSAFFVICGILFCFLLYCDVRRNPQSMKIMNAVWPLTALWGSWLGLWAYIKMGREEKGQQASMEHMDMANMDMSDMSDMGSSKPMWQRIALSTLHCGAGCTLADLIGEWLTYFFPIHIFESAIATQWTIDYILALIIGVYFQYAAIQPMLHLPTGKAIVRALKIDFFSLTSWQIGMYGWMAISMWGIYDGVLPAKNSWEFWFLMQIAMLCGFLTAYPMNKILIKLGIKQAM